ncbi:hypothetical protein [Filifactor alocis]
MYHTKIECLRFRDKRMDLIYCLVYCGLKDFWQIFSIALFVFFV